MTVSEIITAVDNFAWGPVLIIFSLGCGLLFSPTNKLIYKKR